MYDGQSVQRSAFAFQSQFVGAVSARERIIGGNRDKGVQRVLMCIDAPEQALRQFTGTEVAAAESGREFRQRSQVKFV